MKFVIFFRFLKFIFDIYFWYWCLIFFSFIVLYLDPLFLIRLLLDFDEKVKVIEEDSKVHLLMALESVQKEHVLIEDDLRSQIVIWEDLVREERECTRGKSSSSHSYIPSSLPFLSYPSTFFPSLSFLSLSFPSLSFLSISFLSLSSFPFSSLLSSSLLFSSLLFSSLLFFSIFFNFSVASPFLLSFLIYFHPSPVFWF